MARTGNHRDKETKSKTKSPRENTLHTVQFSVSLMLKTVKWFLILLVIGSFLAGGAAIGFITSLVHDEEVRSKEQIYAAMRLNSESGFVYFRDGTRVGQFRSGQDQRLAELDEIPQTIIDAFLATEDEDFMEHPGIDISGLLRAIKQQALNEEVQTGGSTITQQLARRVFLSFDQTMSRKAKEIFLSLRLERFMSKEEILLAYLNKIPFGNGSNGYNVYGIKAAAKGIFDIDRLSDLHLAQSAYLAGLPQNPSAYSAFDGYGNFDEDDFQRAMERQRLVLSRMLEENKISQNQYDDALKFDIRASMAESKKRAYTAYPFLMHEAERRAAEILLKVDNPDWTTADLRKDENQTALNNAVQQLINGGYHVHLTIDQKVYDMMQEVAHNPELFTPDHPEKGVEQIGAVLLDNQDGAIRGFIAGRDYFVEKYNHATQAVRQPGSTMKPIAAFLPALEAGKVQPASIIDDVPYIMEDGSKGVHLPNNWNNTFHGLMTARHALNRSYNIPALKLFNDVVGIENAWSFVKDLGITTLTESDNYARTGVIGGLAHGVTVEELTNAYSSIPNGGVYKDAYMVEKIVDKNGKVIYEFNPHYEEVYSEETAYLMTDMLKTVISDPVATGHRVTQTFEHYGEIEVAGKTGSTQFDRDAWFMGFTPDMTLGVWAGYDQNHTLSRSVDGPQGPGTHRARNIWSIVLDRTIELRPDWFESKEFSRPENIVSMTVSNASGKLPGELAVESNRLITDIFNREHIPTEEGDALVETQYVVHEGLNYLPSPDTPPDMIREGILVRRPSDLKQLLQQIEEILNEMPASQRPKKRGAVMTIEDYYPLDIGITAPTEVDPRTDDGNPPQPPVNVELIKLEGQSQNKITFEPSPSEDVVGYRFYRSLDGAPFGPPAQRILNGKELVVMDYVSEQYDYAYFLTAVDVAGNESEPSRLLLTNESRSDDFLFPDEEDPDENRDNEDPLDNDTDPGELSGDDDLETPQRPEGVEVKKIEKIAEINWKPNPAADQVEHYVVYYSRERSGPYRKIGQSETTELKYIALIPEGFYRVTAVNRAGDSPPSTPAELE